MCHTWLSLACRCLSGLINTWRFKKKKLGWGWSWAWPRINSSARRFNSRALTNFLTHNHLGNHISLLQKWNLWLLNLANGMWEHIGQPSPCHQLAARRLPKGDMGLRPFTQQLPDYTQHATIGSTKKDTDKSLDSQQPLANKLGFGPSKSDNIPKKGRACAFLVCKGPKYLSAATQKL